MIASAAISTFAFPSEFPSCGKYKYLKGFFFILIIFLSNILTVGCLSTLIDFK